MSELKQHLLKIQNFAMETNLSLMKAKQVDKSLEELDESVPEEDEEGEEDET